MRRFAFLSTLALVCLPTGLLAQPPAPPKPGAKQQPSAAQSYTVEQIRTRVRFENDGTARREKTLAIKVLDELAVRTFGELRLAYQSESETLTITQVDVQKPDGSVTSTPTTAIQDVDVRPPTPAATYLDVRQKIITVAALRPGDVLKVTGVWSITRPIAKGHFWFEHTFDVTEVVHDEELEIDVPAQRTVALKRRDGSPAEEHGGAGVVSGDRRLYRWKTAHPEPPPDEPIRQQGPDAPAADVRLSSFKDWNEFAAWYGSLISPASDQTIKAKAAALVAGATDDTARIAAIYRFVSTEIRYVSLSFGIGRYAPHAPAAVMTNQYGDCKDKAILLNALLDAAGVRSVPVLLNTRRSISDDFASPLEFDHVIALVPSGSARGDTWLDATLEVAPPGMLAPPERNRKTLRVDRPGVAAVVTTPADPPFPSIDEVSLDASVNAIGVLIGKVTVSFRGDSELAARTLARTLDRDDVKKWVTAYADGAGIDGDLSEISTSEPAATAESFRISFSLRKPAYLDWAAERSEAATLLKLNSLGATPEDRKGLDRLDMGTPRMTRLHASIELPVGYEAVAPPQVAASKAGIEYSADYKVEGRRIVVDREIRSTVRELRAAEFGDYSVLAGIAEKDFAQPFKVRRTGKARPTPPPDATAMELYKAAYSAYDAKRYEDAAALWARTTEVDPKMGDAWISLGLAYKELQKYDEAIGAIQKEIALDPNNNRVYRDLGSVFDAAGKREEAATAYARHIEINPLDGETLKDLGALYDNLGRYADAAAVLEKAAAILKPDAWVFAQLGSAHLHVKAIDRARAAFDRALEIGPTVAVRTKIAWELAEAGIDLERAKTLATLAEKEIADATQHLDAASVKTPHLDFVERAAWDWDALGWIAFRNGQVADAERYVRAAWQVLGKSAIAFHLAQILEKQDHLADALSYYLTAQALTSRPTDDMRAHVKKLSGGGDLTAMLSSAKRMATGERTVRLSEKASDGTAQFFVIVGSPRTVSDVRFTSGAEGLKTLDEALRRVTYPIGVPGDPRLRLALGVRVKCDTKIGCAALVLYPYQVKLQ